MENLDQELDKLFAAYRNAFAEQEGGSGFLPGVWERIEARRSVVYRFRRIAQGFIGASAVACMLMFCLFVFSERRVSQVPRESYLDALASNPSSEGIMETIHAESGEADQR